MKYRCVQTTIADTTVHTTTTTWGKMCVVDWKIHNAAFKTTKKAMHWYVRAWDRCPRTRACGTIYGAKHIVQCVSWLAKMYSCKQFSCTNMRHSHVDCVVHASKQMKHSGPITRLFSKSIPIANPPQVKYGIYTVFSVNDAWIARKSFVFGRHRS